MYNVTAIQLFSDNYAWRLDTPDGRAVLVDPADAKACLAALNTVALAGVLSTHYHHDHAGDNEALARAVPGLMIVGGFDEGARVPAVTRAVRDGDSVDIGGLHFECLHTPCHTRGHIIYYIPSGSDGTPGSLFTGDTLFAGGCGRFFEGGPAEMLAALSRLALLPSDTRIFCGHEYTVANLQFCLHVEPDNDATAARLAEAVALRAAGLPTVPSTIGLELATNVFMRTRVAAVSRFTHADHTGPGEPDPVEVMARLRATKNSFKPTSV